MNFTVKTQVFSKEDLYTYAEIISTEGHIPFEDLIRSLEKFFSETGRDLVKVIFPVPLYGDEDLPDYESTKIMLEKSLDSMECQAAIDNIRQFFIRWCRESWHTHHKEGKPCKAKVKPPYWQRIRSFCVRKHYH